MHHTFRTCYRTQRRGIALIITMIFVLVFSTLSAALFTMSVSAVQASENHQDSNHALNAALSGLEYARYLAMTAGSLDVVLDYTAYKAGNYASQADVIWSNLISSGGLVTGVDTDGFTYAETGTTAYDDAGATFNVRFVRQDANTFRVVCSGQTQGLERAVEMTFKIEKEEDDILNYGLVGRGRMWITGDTTIHGDIYSSWDNARVSPFNMTADSTVEGTINTVLTNDTMQSNGYQLETLNSADQPLFEFATDVYDVDGNAVSDTYGTVDEFGYLVDADGQAVFDIDGNRVPLDFANRVVSSGDEVQGYHENINYNVNKNGIDNYLDIDSYDTSVYYDMTSSNTIEPDTTTETVTTSGWQYIDGRWRYVTTTEEVEVPVTTTEYFPHGAGGYDDYKSGSITLNRNVYTNRTFTDAYLSSNQNALFENCTFEGVLYIDCSQYTSSSYNNIRFNDCTFNGVIVTNTPDELSWQRNALYFTGSANFDNQSDIQEATILAPHFNVNLGDANNGEVESAENVITGAVVGGIVDIRGNAEIFGTVISMCDTSQWTNGFVTNIGATLDDGGSETTSIEDVGTIDVTPDPEQMLFPGLSEYYCTITLRPDADTYSEIH